MRIEINPSNDNEIHFYGDRGDTTVEELATIGIKSQGGDNIVGLFGSLNSGYSRVSVKALSYDGSAIKAETISGVAIEATSGDGGDAINVNTAGTTARGVVVVTDTYYGANISAGNYYGAIFAGGSSYAPIVLTASGSASAPTHTATKGALWVTSAGVLYINTSGSTTWAKVGAQ